MEDDGYLKDVEDAYRRLVGEGHDPSSENLWDLAKHSVKWRSIFKRALDISKREGRDYAEIVAEHVKEERQREIN